MDASFPDGAAARSDAREYAQFCRFRGLFLVDGLESWMIALKTRGLPEDRIGEKLSAARAFVRRMGEL